MMTRDSNLVTVKILTQNIKSLKTLSKLFLTLIIICFEVKENQQMRQEYVTRQRDKSHRNKVFFFFFTSTLQQS